MALAVVAIPTPQDPSGDKNIGNGQGGQFITGACISDADCASGCCAVFNDGGVCSAPAVSFAQGKQGCGFSGAGGAASTNTGAADGTAAGGAAADTTNGAATSGIDTSKPGSQNVGKGDASQFITGQCLSDADCASGCCAGLNGGGVCSAVAVAFAQGKQGCGFTASGSGSTADAGAGAATGNNAAAGGAADGAANSGVAAGVDSSLAGSQNVGKGDGSQFITGQCLSDADCASACCNKNTGICNAPGAIGAENCGFQG